MKLLIGNEKDIKNNLIDRIEIENKTYIVHYYQKNVCVFDSKCPHAQGSLLSASYENEYIICPSHGIKFNLKDGKANIDDVKDDFKNSIIKKGIENIALCFLHTENEYGLIYLYTNESKIY